jgi:single-strand DNA-binding protein
MNSVTIKGRLTTDAKVYGKGDNKVVYFGLAYNDRIKKGDEWVDQPSFFDVKVFIRAKDEETIKNTFSKGKAVVVNGKVLNKYNKEGEREDRAYILLRNIWQGIMIQ